MVPNQPTSLGFVSQGPWSAAHANVRNGRKADIGFTRLFGRAVVKRRRDSNNIDKTELVPDERLGRLFRAVCLCTSHPRGSEGRLMSVPGGKQTLAQVNPQTGQLCYVGLATRTKGGA